MCPFYYHFKRDKSVIWAFWNEVDVKWPSDIRLCLLVPIINDLIIKSFMQKNECYFPEIASCRVVTSGKKRYFVDLKRHNGFDKTTYVKISELSNGRRSSVILGLEGQCVILDLCT